MELHAARAKEATRATIREGFGDMQRSSANRLHCALERSGSIRFPRFRLRVVWPIVAYVPHRLTPWLDIEEQGYVLVRCELAVFKPEE
jgi:hypothetical protein